MEKMLLKSEKDLQFWLIINSPYDILASPEQFPPQSYPCIIVSAVVGNINGKDLVSWQYVYPEEFYDANSF